MICEKFFQVNNYRQLRKDSFKFKRIPEEHLKTVIKKQYYGKKINNEPAFETNNDQPASSQGSQAQSSEDENKPQNDQPKESPNEKADPAPAGGSSQPAISSEAPKKSTKAVHSHIVLQSLEEDIMEENTILMPYYKPGY